MESIVSVVRQRDERSAADLAAVQPGDGSADTCRFV